MSGSSRRVSIAKPLIGAEEIEAVRAVLESGQIAEGPRAAAFEEAFAAYTGTKHAVAVNSGTAALLVALQAHGVGPGDEVITTPFSFIATATSIIATGARPVFVDVADSDLNLDPDRVEAAISPRTRAIMPVHLYGNPAAIGPLMAIAGRHGLALVEDAAQAHGASIGGARAGSFGTGAFSFYPTKNMTTAEGGMITTNDDEAARRARSIRSHGQTERYRHELFGLNWRMTDIAAAIGLVQLGHLDDWNAARIRNAAALNEAIAAYEIPSARLRLPQTRKGTVHVFHQYTIRLPRNRDAVQRYLAEHGVGCAIHYPTPIHRQPIMVERGLGDADVPVAERAAAEVLSLPVHPSVTADDVAYIAATLAEAIDAAG